MPRQHWLFKRKQHRDLWVQELLVADGAAAQHVLLRAEAGMAGAVAVVLIILETVEAEGVWGTATMGEGGVGVGAGGVVVAGVALPLAGTGQRRVRARMATAATSATSDMRRCSPRPCFYRVFFEQRVGVCSASDAAIKITINTRHAYPAAAGHLSRANEPTRVSSFTTCMTAFPGKAPERLPRLQLPPAASHIMCHTSRVTCHVLRVTRHASQRTCGVTCAFCSPVISAMMMKAPG
jgi:hypothetical protein